MNVLPRTRLNGSHRAASVVGPAKRAPGIDGARAAAADADNPNAVPVSESPVSAV